MFARAKMLSMFLAAFIVTNVQASWIGVAFAQEVPVRESLQAELSPRLEGRRARGRAWAERLGRETSEVREARRARKLDRLRFASPAERRRILRRERRITRFLPETERRALRRERQKFAEELGMGSWHEGGGGEVLRTLDLSAQERRVLRGRFRQLSKQERRDLRQKVVNMRELPASERELLRERLHEMKSLTENEKRAFDEKKRRWSEMSEAKREKMRAQMRRLRALPTDERLELLERALNMSEGRAKPVPK